MINHYGLSLFSPWPRDRRLFHILEGHILVDVKYLLALRSPTELWPPCFLLLLPVSPYYLLDKSPLFLSIRPWAIWMHNIPVSIQMCYPQKAIRMRNFYLGAIRGFKRVANPQLLPASLHHLSQFAHPCFVDPIIFSTLPGFISSCIVNDIHLRARFSSSLDI